MERVSFNRFFLLSLALLTLGACGGSDGDSSSVSGSGSVVSSPKSMGTGDVAYADLSSGSGSVEFPSSGTFKVLIQSHATDGLTNTYTLGSLNAAGKSLGLGEIQSDLTLAESEISDQDLLDGTLRDNDLYWSSQDLGGGMAKFLSSGKSVSKGVGGDISPTISVNDTATLYVLNSLTDTTNCVQVTATAKYVGSNIAVFIDNEILDNNSADLPQSDIDAMGAIYDSQYSDVTGWLGGVSDINSDGATIALITSQINKLTSSGGGIVTGYFNSDDLSDYNAGTNPCSNAREIVYLVAPDANGIYSSKVSNSFWKSNFGPSVFPHELQHLINHYQRVVVKGASAESACLNEGLSHLIEDLVGYNVENYSRYDLFLASPQSYSACGGTSLALRGGIYLFLRYLYERSGDSKAFLQNMVQSSDKNYTNIVNAFPSKTSDFDSIGEFLRQWAVALGYTDKVSTAAKFKYNARVKNSTTGNWEGVCMDCSAQDNRGTILSGPTYGTYSGGSYSLKDAATRFLKINSNPSKITFTANTASKGHAIILRTN